MRKKLTGALSLAGAWTACWAWPATRQDRGELERGEHRIRRAGSRPCEPGAVHDGHDRRW